MKRCRTCNRKYKDETYEYCLDDGTPLSGAFDLDATLVLDDPFDLNATIHIDDSANETSDVTAGTRKQKKKPRKNFINDPVIAISVNEQFLHCDTGDDLYTCTRGLWRLNRERAEHAKYVFAIFKGKIKEVYEIEQWLPATEAFSDFWIAKLESQGRTISADEHNGRYEFTGHLAAKAIRKKYLGRKLPKRHSGNPILYFNC
jgi:hypothetical protein